MDRTPRLAFGQVAERYDRVRPSYPDALVDEVIALAGAGRALEVGAGTGKATLMFAQRGVGVRAVEPSPEMASIARVRCADFPGVTIEETDFEDWHGDLHAFALVFSAQAWHWVSPEEYARAGGAHGYGGWLAADETGPMGALRDARTSLQPPTRRRPQLRLDPRRASRKRDRARSLRELLGRARSRRRPELEDAARGCTT